ncbi:Soyasaponin III rhamnosyltransferase [Bertholletia excelsa]
MLSYLELAKFLAQGSHKVSFVSTHRNIQRLPKPPPQLSLFVDFVKLALPRVEEIPANAEATMGVRSEDIHYLKKAYDGLAAELAQFLRSYCADWILHDFASHWLPPITAELGIPTAFLSIAAAWFPAFLGSSSMLLNGSDPWSKPEDFTVPPECVRFPTKIVFRPFEIKRLFSAGGKNASGVWDPYRVGRRLPGATFSRCGSVQKSNPNGWTCWEKCPTNP